MSLPNNVLRNFKVKLLFFCGYLYFNIDQYFNYFSLNVRQVKVPDSLPASELLLNVHPMGAH